MQSACPPLLGLAQNRPGLENACNDHNRRVLTYLAGTPGIDLVILHARWALATEGTRIRGEGGPPFVVSLISETDSATGTLSQEALIAYGLERVVARLTELGVRVAILEGIPEIGFRVPELLLENTLVRLSEPRVPNIDAVRVRNAAASRIFDALDQKYPLQRLSLQTQLCDPECAIFGNGGSLYRDDDHLSNYGARLLVPVALTPLSLRAAKSSGSPAKDLTLRETE